MGLTRYTLDLLVHELKVTGMRLQGLKICELGWQQLQFSPSGFSCGEAASKFLESLGAHVTTIDLRGSSLPNDGHAIALDLRRPITDSSLIGRFDVVTNLGTLEHVEDLYIGTRNARVLCRDGGLIFHSMPRVGGCYELNHGFYSFYAKFFVELARIYEDCLLTVESQEGCCHAFMVRSSAFVGDPRCGPVCQDAFYMALSPYFKRVTISAIQDRVRLSQLPSNLA